MTTDNRTRVEAAAAAIHYLHCGCNRMMNHFVSMQDKYREQARAALAAAAAVVTVDGLQERIEDTLAYYQCRETNPKADHQYMGYHAFSEEQREFLRERKAEAAAEIVRMILALLRGGKEQ
ncbi:MAG: hypothetical protein KKF42_03290 [Actinobacteria bacterium]|nr:hypothetical protein [Actinomycetota bacterium]